jgi:hypothetical protein
VPDPLGNKGVLLVPFADNATKSSPIELKGNIPVGLKTGAGWVSATVTFEVSLDNITYVPLEFDDSGAAVAVSITGVGPSKMIAFDPGKLLPTPWIKIVSSVSQTGGPFNLELILKEF